MRLPAGTIAAIIKQSEAVLRLFIFTDSKKNTIEKLGLENFYFSHLLLNWFCKKIVLNKRILSKIKLK